MAFVGSFAAFAQITPEQLRQFVSENKHIVNAAIKNPSEVKEFYARLNNKTAWVQKENSANREFFFNALQLCAGMGLREKDYQFSYIESFRDSAFRLHSKADSLEAELRFTDAAIHFYNDIAYGNITPMLGYIGLNYIPGCKDIPALPADHVSKNMLRILTTHLSPALPEITAMEYKIRWFHSVIDQPDFREAIITSSKINGSNKPLISKLYQLGIIDSGNKKYLTVC